MAEPTPQQAAAINKEGRVIVSASAGSGKTFVMIERLVSYVEKGGDLDGVLAVTFTKKAAAQMKEKLRSALIKRTAGASDALRAHIKEQLSKIPLANISTIHSFCGYLLRVYFYLLDIDGSFEIISEDGGAEAQMRSRALEALFDRLYEEEDADFLYLVACYGKKRSDGALKGLVTAAYDAVRNVPDFRAFLEDTARADEDTFNAICGGICADARAKCEEFMAEVHAFAAANELNAACKKIAGEMEDILSAAARSDDIFTPLPKFVTSRKPPKSDDDPVCKQFFALRDYIKGRYEKLYEGIGAREEELAAYLSTARTARAFSNLVLAFDDEYSALKREEGKLDYGDLEHLTLKLLDIDGMRDEIRSRFKQVFVDEYQDVNPVQERIISLVGGKNLFLVGDVKQAIYGFRGSRSEYFTKKTEEFAACGGALYLSHNFRSAPKVIEAVNASFSQLMRADTCGIDYAGTSQMIAGGAYPPSGGGAYVHIFGRDEKSKKAAEGVYSVERDVLQRSELTREGLAVLDVVRRELSSTFFDIEQGCVRAVEPRDICILTRKRDNSSPVEIARALSQAGIPVSGGQGGNACDFPEVKQMLDILSYIDNGEQDIPMASAMLSPVGGFSEDELSEIKICYREDKTLTFRACCEKFAEEFKENLGAAGGIARKLQEFYKNVDEYRKLAQLSGAGTLIDEILSRGGLEAKYCRDGAKKLKNVRRLAEAAYTPSGELNLSEFLNKIKSGGYKLAVAEGGGEGSVTMMTMHSSKGLEFPVVIIADVSCSFRGQGGRALPFDEKYGFAHNMFDLTTRVTAPTVLDKLIKLKTAREEVRGEMNLLYVACTRAKYRLHIMSSAGQCFNSFRVAGAGNYAQMLDFNCFRSEDEAELDFSFEQPSPALISRPDGAAEKALLSRFMQPYKYQSCVDLAVKSSATALLKAAEEPYYAENVLFPDDDESFQGDMAAAAPALAQKHVKRDKKQGGGYAGSSSAERGTAYHRFLQLCDFSVKGEEDIAEELKKFVSAGQMSEEAAALLSVRSLSKILTMSCFAFTEGANVFREREFLCALPADEFLPTDAKDSVLVQGAIDLLCEREGRYTIIDYKYSSRPADEIVKKYTRQLDLYRLAVQKILGVPKEEVGAYIVNIRSLEQIKLN